MLDNTANSLNTAGNLNIEAGNITTSSTATEDSVFPSTNLHGVECMYSCCVLPPVNTNLLKNQQQDLVESVSASLDLSQTFFLNSLLGANQTIYLDFDGNITSGTLWNVNFTSGANIVTPAFDFDGNITSFSSSELERIQYIWQRVAEDFSPFNVNVTTQTPADINACSYRW
jgi:serralysin